MAAVSIVLLTAIGVVSIKELSFRFKQHRCRENMLAVHYLAVTEYTSAYGPNLTQVYCLPAPDLKDFLPRLPYRWPDMAESFVCPGTRQEPRRLEDLKDWMSYIYIDWSPYFGNEAPPADYPLMYDKSMDNHGGRGINILRVGTGAIWDENAESLKAFAAEHPEYDIRMPE